MPLPSAPTRAERGPSAQPEPAARPSSAGVQLRSMLRPHGYDAQAAMLSPVQRRAGRGASGGDAAGAVQAIARAGTEAGRASLPHAAKIQASFGGFDVAGVQAHLGAEATEASQAIGAEAYATGEDVVFGRTPDLHTAAHEAAHVVQQRAGVALSGGVGQAGDAYERHADQVADAVVAGQSAEGLLAELPGGGRSARKVQRLGKGPGELPGAKRGSGAGGVVCQRKENELASIVHSDINPVTGLERREDQWVTSFVHKIGAALSSWDSQRGTSDLEFKEDTAVVIAFRQLSHATIAVNEVVHDLIWKAAREQLKVGKNEAYVREIRMFNRWSLDPLRRLLDVQDAEAAHVYEMTPVGATTLEGNAGVAKLGKIWKTIEIGYTNTLIPGLAWKQRVALSGWMVGAGISVSAVKDLIGKKGSSGGKGDNSKSKDDEGPQDPNGYEANAGIALPVPGAPAPVGAKETPREHYLAPDFFQGAEFTSPAAGATASFTVADAKMSPGSALLIRKGAEDILFADEPKNAKDYFSFEGSPDLRQLGDLIFEDDLGGIGGSGIDVSVDAAIEFGETEQSGGLEFQAGEWGTPADARPPSSSAWTPLHRATVYFGRGEDELEPARDMKTIESLAKLAFAFNADSKRNQTKLFKVEVIGCHSQVFAEHDDELRELEAKREAKGTLSPKDERRYGDLLATKEMENWALALRRAENTSDETMKAFYDQGRGQPEWRSVLEWSEFAPPRTREPSNLNPYSASEGDCSATVVVSYQLHSTLKDTLEGARERRRAEENGE